MDQEKGREEEKFGKLLFIRGYKGVYFQAWTHFENEHQHINEFYNELSKINVKNSIEKGIKKN